MVVKLSIGLLMLWSLIGCNSLYKELQKENQLREKRGEEFLLID